MSDAAIVTIVSLETMPTTMKEERLQPLLLRLPKASNTGKLISYFLSAHRGGDFERRSHHRGGEKVHYGGQKKGHAKEEKVKDAGQKPEHRVRGRGE